MDGTASPPFFVVGCPRSGTTLLRDLLRSHPRLTLPGESHFIPPLHAAFGEPGSAAEARRLARVLLACPFVKSWRLSASVDDLAARGGFAEIVGGLFEAWAAGEGRPRWGDKTPQYVLHLPLLARLFPGAKFVHVIRDGRDAALSLAGHPMGPRNLLAAARLWSRCVRAGRDAGESLGPRYHEVRYEDLLSDTAGAMGRLLAFLGEPFTEAVLAGTPLAAPAHPPIGLAASRPVAGHQGRWRREMAAADRAVFEGVAGDLLRELGYECEAARPLPRAQATLLAAENGFLMLAARVRPANASYVWPSVWMAAATWPARLSRRLG